MMSHLVWRQHYWI